MESRTKDIETLDTCLILRAMLMDVPAQFERVAKMLKREGVRYYVPDMAVVEAVHVMENERGTYRFPRRRIAELILGFLGKDNICNGDGMFQPVFELYLTHPKLSLVDCYLAVQTELQKTDPLWTFDKKLANQTEAAKLA